MGSLSSDVAQSGTGSPRRARALLLFAALGLSGCGGGGSEPTPASVASVTVAPANPSILVGGTVQLTATPKDANGTALTGLTVSWASTDAAIASVNASSGLLTGVAVGTASIVATVSGVDGTTNVTVSSVPVASVTVDPGTADVHSGTTLQLAATPKDGAGAALTGRTVAWSTSNGAVATVNPTTGLVSGIAAGTATITATVETKTGTSTITVGEPAFLSVEAGADVACGIITRAPGETVCWGNGDATGALGNNGTSPPGGALSPFPVDPTLAFTSVSNGLGTDHVCAATSANVGYCWGWNNDGELGEGGILPGLPSGSPGLILGSLSWTQVSAGNASSCGVVTGGTAYCWGSMSGGLGDQDSTVSSSAPIKVDVVTTFTSVNAANQFACGMTTAKRIFCWGANDRGQLGDGTTDAHATPVEVLGNRTYAVLSARHQHACAVATTGAGFCWGPDDNGQGGTGGGVGNNTEPTPIAGGHVFTTISAGYLHACGVDTDGKAWCWGDNTAGQLGTGGSGSIQTAPVAVTGGHTFTSISAGVSTTCALSTTGDAYCWGSGILGDGGAFTENDSPVRVAVPAP